MASEAIAQPSLKSIATIHDEPGYTKEELSEQLFQSYASAWLSVQQDDIYVLLIWDKCEIDRLRLSETEREAAAAAVPK